MKKNIVYQSTANFLRFLDNKSKYKNSKDSKLEVNSNKKEITLDLNYNTKQELAY